MHFKYKKQAPRSISTEGLELFNYQNNELQSNVFDIKIIIINFEYATKAEN